MDELYRVLRAASFARQSRALPDGRYEARDVARAGRGRAGDPRRGHDRGRRDRDRLHGDVRAARRQPQLPARRHPLGLLLRRALPDRARTFLPPAAPTRLSASRAPEGSLVNARPPGGRRRRQHRDVEPHRRRRLRRAFGEAVPVPGPGPGDDEQRHVRQPSLHVLRDDRGRAGRVPGRRRAERRSRRDVEHAQHAGRGARARRIRCACERYELRRGSGGGGSSPRRRRRRPRAPRPRGLPRIPPYRAPGARPVRARRWRRRRARPKSR